MTQGRRLAALIALLTLLLASVALAQETTGEIPPEAAAAMGVGIIVWVVMMLVSLAVSIGIAVFLYKDATRRGGSAAGWAVFGFFLPILALIIWLIVRPKQ
ncbi:MAG: hypothetical protein FJX74_11710 [Armatimonadetes bacterium]|nr:hypothetical protein [Armatimonadota bacterium]